MDCFASLAMTRLSGSEFILLENERNSGDASAFGEFRRVLHHQGECVDRICRGKPDRAR